MKQKRWFLMMIMALLTLFGAVQVHAAEEAYRNIRVLELSGGAWLTRGELELPVYAQLVLQDGDEIRTEEDGYVVLKLDEDKYIAVTQDTSVRFELEGSDGNGAIRIHLEHGFIYNEIENPLTDTDHFEVHSADSVMAVRGTSFGVGTDDMASTAVDGVSLLLGLEGLSGYDSEGDLNREYVQNLPGKAEQENLNVLVSGIVQLSAWETKTKQPRFLYQLLQVLGEPQGTDTSVSGIDTPSSGLDIPVNGGDISLGSADVQADGMDSDAAGEQGDNIINRRTVVLVDEGTVGVAARKADGTLQAQETLILTGQSCVIDAQAQLVQDEDGLQEIYLTDPTLSVGKSDEIIRQYYPNVEYRETIMDYTDKEYRITAQKSAASEEQEDDAEVSGEQASGNSAGTSETQNTFPVGSQVVLKIWERKLDPAQESEWTEVEKGRISLKGTGNCTEMGIIFSENDETEQVITAAAPGTVTISVPVFEDPAAEAASVTLKFTNADGSGADQTSAQIRADYDDLYADKRREWKIKGKGNREETVGVYFIPAEADGIVCPACKKKGTVYDDHLLECGDDVFHYSCDRRNHEELTCGTEKDPHYACDGKTHETCTVCQGVLCDGKTHGLGVCAGEVCPACQNGVWSLASHYMRCGHCPYTAGEHAELACGTENDPHFACSQGTHGICSGCDGALCDGEDHEVLDCGTKKNPHYACDGKRHRECRGCGEMRCDGNSHKRLECGTEENPHYVCDGDSHEACSICGKYQCDGKDHTQLSCGTTEAPHYACDGQNHTACASCGKYQCDGQNHTACASCGKYQCDGQSHTACASCGKYQCDGQSHTACVSCGRYQCDGQNHTACASCGKYQCDGQSHTACVSCGEMKCLEGDHTQLSCGTAEAPHYACDDKTHETCSGCGQMKCNGNDHTALACGTAEAPHCANDGKTHETCSGCGQMKCNGNDHTALPCGTAEAPHCVNDGRSHDALPCGHYACLTASDEPGYHDPAGECFNPDHYWCDGQFHGIADCGAEGHAVCDGSHTECPGCGWYLCPEYAHDCDTCGGYTCDGKDHEVCPSCGQKKCNGNDHTELTCGTADTLHYACDGANHAVLPCGHYACDGGYHDMLPCGHYACDPNYAELAEHDLMPCGQHYACDESFAEPGEHNSAADYCGNADHYLCDGKDHILADCKIEGHALCDEKNHTAAACGTEGHTVCDGKNHNPADCGIEGHMVCTEGPPHSVCPGVCGTYSCEQTHYICETCGKYSCDTSAGTHRVCEYCGDYITCRLEAEHVDGVCLQ